MLLWPLHGAKIISLTLNHLSAIPRKWSNILKQLVGCFRRIVQIYLTILWGWYLKDRDTWSYPLILGCCIPLYIAKRFKKLRAIGSYDHVLLKYQPILTRSYYIQYQNLHKSMLNFITFEKYYFLCLCLLRLPTCF